MAAPTSGTKKTSWLSRKITSQSSIASTNKAADISDVRTLELSEKENSGESWEVLTIRKKTDDAIMDTTDSGGQGANKLNRKSTRGNPLASPILGGRTSAGGIRPSPKSEKKMMEDRPVSAGAVSKRKQLTVDTHQNGRSSSPGSERNSSQRSSFRRKKVSDTGIKSSSPAPREMSPSQLENDLDKQESAFSKVRDTLRIRKGKKKKGKVQYTVPELNLPNNSKYQDPFEVQPDYSENGIDVDSGHEFKFVNIPHNKPEYCDHCQQTAWGHHQVLKCSKCEFICHKKCESRVFLKCSSKTESEAVLQQDRTKETLDETVEISSSKEVTNKAHHAPTSLDSTSSHLNSEKAVLARKIREYNRKTTPVHHIHIKPRDVNIDYQGFVRVHMCIQRPIHVSTGVTRTSWYRLMRPVKERSIDSGIDAGLETAFYLPTDTNRLVHITNITTTKELIITLLKKFCITDNYKKFSLYEEYGSDSRRLFDEDNPLKVSLEASVAGRNSKIVLRDNLCSTIQWDAFSLPELQNFIIILQREEEIYLSRLRECFMIWKKHIEDTMKDCPHNEHPLSIKHEAPVKM